MKKVLLASLLTLVSAVPMVSMSHAQLGTQQPAGKIQMSEEEYAAYNNANTQTDPTAKAAAFEAYLKAYPNSAVKADVLGQLVYIYSSGTDQAKTLDAADRLLAIDKQNLRALTLEVYYRRVAADALTDPAAKTAALDAVAAYAQTGLSATKPKDMSDADFNTLKAATQPTFESAIADDDLSKKDNAGAVTALKAEIEANKPMTEKASPVLQDVYTLAQAYYTMTPPDYFNCAWYAARAAAFAPEPYKTTITQLATYCYQKFHGNKDGIADLNTAVLTNLDPPATFKITPAPKPEDIVANLIATTPDLATLALSDKEFVLQYGKQADADKVFDTIKGKSVEIPGVVTGVSADMTQLMLAVSDDAVQGKTPDFTIQMKAALTKAPAVGEKVSVTGTYASYTQTPLMITMSDGELVAKKAPAKTPAKAPVHHTTHK